MKTVRSFTVLSFGLLVAVFSAGCGSSVPIAVSVASSATQTDQGQAITVTATILNDSSNRGVTWSLNGPGSLSVTSPTSVTYTAPSSVTASQMATVTANSVADARKSGSVQLTVNPPPQIPFQSLPTGTMGLAYNQAIAESGGSPPFTWTVPPGQMPTGLSLNPTTGVISGTPTGGGTWYFVANLVDAAGYSTYSNVVSIQINSNVALGNPVPMVYQPLMPDTVVPGGPGFNMTVNETGFRPGATVNFNGKPLLTTYVNSEQLIAAVPPSDISSRGTASLTAVNPAPGGGRSNVVYLPVATPEAAVNFSAAVGSPIPAYFAVSVVADDFNGDAKPDLAIAYGTRVGSFLGNGDGTFTPAAGSPILIQPPPWDTLPTPYTSFLALGDFNNSGKVGLAVSFENNMGAAILLGGGNGAFTPSSAFAYIQGFPVRSVIPGDFNGDGNLDLAAASNGSGISVDLLLGFGDGAFTPVPESPFGVFAGATAIATGDFNGDGKLDLAVSSNGLTILLGSGDGTFTQAPGSPIAVAASYSIAVADFNGDGKLDLAIANNQANTVTIMLGKGDGTFTQSSGSPIAVGSTPYAIAAGDFTGSGKLGLAVANFGDNNITILAGNGDGTFTQAAGSPIPVGKGPISLAVADFNGSGRLGLAAANLTDGTVTVLLQH